MIDLSTKARHPDHWVKLDAEFQADLAWWENFISVWNARSMMEVHNPKWTPTVIFPQMPPVHGAVAQSGDRHGYSTHGMKNRYLRASLLKS